MSSHPFQDDPITFAAREGSGARTLAYTQLPTQRRARPAVAAATRTNDGAPVSLSPSPATPAARAVPPHAPSSQDRPAATSGTVAFGRGQTIFSPGHGQGMVYIVRSGCVRLFKVLPDQRSINIGLLGPNTVFTQEDSVDGLATGATAEAMVDSVVAIVPTSAVGAIIAESPGLAAAMVSGMSRRLTELQTLVEHLLVRDTAVRLATTLIALAERFGRPTADGLTAIALPLTHQSLAGMIGSNRVTVTRKLLELQELGCIRSLGRNALAVDPERLRGYAHPSVVDGKGTQPW